MIHVDFYDFWQKIANHLYFLQIYVSDVDEKCVAAAKQARNRTVEGGSQEPLRVI